MRRLNRTETISPRVKIAAPWMGEVTILDDEGKMDGYTQDGVLVVSLVNLSTGEIRQKRISVDTLVRRIFASEIASWKKRWGDDPLWTVRTAKRAALADEGKGER